MEDIEITLPSVKEILGKKYDSIYGGYHYILVKCLKVIHKYNTAEADITGLVKLRGGSDEYWTRSADLFLPLRIVPKDYYCYSIPASSVDVSVRPMLKLSKELFNKVTKERKKIGDYPYEVDVILYGEYPQSVPVNEIQDELNRALENDWLIKTGRKYTFNYSLYNVHKISTDLIAYDEYEYYGKRYIHFKQFSNQDDYCWVEVEPVEWLVDDETKTLISKKLLVSDVPYNRSSRMQFNVSSKNRYKKSLIYDFLHKYMLPELLQNRNVKVKNNVSIPTISDEVVNKFAYKLENKSDMSRGEVDELNTAFKQLKLESKEEMGYNLKSRR